MVTRSPINLLDEIREYREEYGTVLIMTDEIDPVFFENKILPFFQDAQNILILIDSKVYAVTFKDAKLAGTHYLLEPVLSRNIFHPKVILLLSKKLGKLIIGSANLTERGFTSNAETVSIFKFDVEDKDLDALQVFLNLKGFLKEFLDKGFVKSEMHQKKIVQALEQTPWLSDRAFDIVSKRVRLLHNLKESILSQFNNLVKERVQAVLIVSPFFDSKAKVLEFVAKNICKTFKIVVQPERVINFPIKEIPSFLRLHKASLEAFEPVFKDRERYLHAKILIFKTKKSCYCLIGSANFTVAGLLSNALTGNIEICVLRKEAKPDYFAYILKNKDLTIRKLELDCIKAQNPQARPSIQVDLNLTEARIDKSKKLTIGFTPEVDSRYNYVWVCIQRSLDVDVNPKTVESTLKDRNKIVLELDETTSKYFESSCWMFLRIGVGRDDLNPLISDKRWVSTERRELLASYKKAVERITESDGRIGLIELLNEMSDVSEAPEVVMYYLSFLDFKWLRDTVDHVREKVTEGLEPIEDKEGVIEERPHLTAEEALKTILNRNQKRFEKFALRLSKSMDALAMLEKLFNFFMFISKLTIWFVINQKAYMSNLRVVRKNLELLADYIDKLREMFGADSINNLVDNLNIVPHAMILIKIVNDLQNRDYKWRDLNVNVIKFFNQTFRESLLSLSQARTVGSLLKLYKGRIERALREYREFRNISLSEQEVLRSMSALKFA